MKHSRADVRGKARLGLDIRFEEQNLTSYSGLILFQHFFSLIDIKERLWGCFRHLKANPIDGHHVIVMLLIVHLVIGHRRLRDKEPQWASTRERRARAATTPDCCINSYVFVRETPLCKGYSAPRMVWLTFTPSEDKLPWSDSRSILLSQHELAFSIAFYATGRYPLFCTIAQTDQVFDVHHRPGNVHDSNGADTFIGHCLSHVRSCLPHAKVETRIDSAFFTKLSLNDCIRRESNSPSRCLSNALPPSKGWSKAENDGDAWRLGSITSRPAGSRSHGTPAIASSSSESRSDANTSCRFNSTCSSPLNTGTNSRSSSPTNE